MTRLSLVLLVIASAQLAAQGVVIPPDGEAQQRGYNVRPTTDRIRLDARFAEPVWQAVDSITDFRQREPLEGAPASERTVVKIVRDAERLYVAVRA